MGYAIDGTEIRDLERGAAVAQLLVAPDADRCDLKIQSLSLLDLAGWRGWTFSKSASDLRVLIADKTREKAIGARWRYRGSRIRTLDVNIEFVEHGPTIFLNAIELYEHRPEKATALLIA